MYGKVVWGEERGGDGIACLDSVAVHKNVFKIGDLQISTSSRLIWLILHHWYRLWCIDEGCGTRCILLLARDG